jgi:riboflavin kinase/FMN adenylyltransferase
VQVRRELPEKNKEACVMALGNFDGVHLGHRRLLANAWRESRHLGISLSVLVFDPHPLKIIRADKKLRLLTTTEQKLDLLHKIGVDIVYLLPFTRAIANTSPHRFVVETLLPLQVRHVFVGFNYSFGAKGQGTPADLQKMGAEFGFKVDVLQAQSIEGQVISSSSIRKALEQGDIIMARKMLGRDPSLFGTVITGEQRGRLLRYPTANISPAEDLLIPKCGVYAVWADIGDKRFCGMMNIGRKPTFHEDYHFTIEVHFFNYQGDLYGKELDIHIRGRLRDERKFSAHDQLIRQLEEDEELIKRRFFMP